MAWACCKDNIAFVIFQDPTPSYFFRLKNPSFFKNKSICTNIKEFKKAKLPQQNDFRTFCMSDETEKTYQKLEEVICT
jgi:hypothetical protein